MALHTEELLLHPNDQIKIAGAVEAAEQRTAVDFHVHVEATCRYPEARARDLLRLAARRPHRAHGMLLYLLAHERRCYIVTDEALRPLEGTRVWRDVTNRLVLDLLHGKLGDGMSDAVGRFSHIVAGHFPGIPLDVIPRSIAR
ncbi:MAG TPA: hypothetical protein VN947_32300 [Polyangia bacterium]|nr:hypothetical protein [Polyangia bacterium]